jgi:hypothetical protein
VKKLLLALTLFAFPCYAEDFALQAIGPFSTLNNTDNPLILPADKAADLLNCDITPNGKSVKKRRGYAQAFALTFSSWPVHGVYNFYESGGSDVSLFFHSRQITSSIGGGSATVLYSTATNDTTWQCTDSQGFAYCVNTSRDGLFRSNGSTVTMIAPAANGTMISVTPERLVLGGFASFPNRLDFSKANDFSTWTTGSAATDAINFTITAPGAKLTHITYAFNRVMWFKDSSFGYVLIGNQPLFSDWVIKTVSPNVGTNDNSSVYWNGILYFRGQDAHIYAYDGSNLTKLTRDITTTIAESQSRRTNSWTQSTQAEFESGSVPTDISTTLNPGSLTAKTTSWALTTKPDWQGMTLAYPETLTAPYLNEYDLTTSSGDLNLMWPEEFTSYRDGSGSTLDVWDPFNSGGAGSISSNGSQLVMTSPSSGFSGARSSGAIPNIFKGTTFYVRIDTATVNSSNAFHLYLSSSDASTENNESFALWIRRVNNKICLDRIFQIDSAGTLIDLFGPGSTANQIDVPADLYLYISTSSYSFNLVTSTSIQGTHTYNPTVRNQYVYLAAGANNTVKLDRFSKSPVVIDYTSPVFDTGISSPVWGTFNATYSTGTGGTGNSLSFRSEVSTNGVANWDASVQASTGATLTANPKRYTRTSGRFNFQVATGTVISLSDYSLTSGSSGSFKSAVKNASSLTAWDSLAGNKLDGVGSHTFYIRSSTFIFTVNSVSPSWTSVSLGAIPSVSTGIYFQIRDDIIATSTGTTRLDDFTQNWFEGQAGDKAYAIYHDDSIWWSVASGDGAATNNKILKYDLLNQGWTIYDIPMNGMLVRAQSLYFGGASEGNIFKFGDVDNDNGTAIEAYWKSKDFFADSPFTDKEIANISVAAASVSNSSTTITYAVNSTTYSFTMPLASSGELARVNKNIPAGRVGRTFNIQFGNDAVDQPFEIFGLQIGFRPRSWRPE